jgi:hypothetical protein
MTKNFCRMAGLFMMMLSVFLLLGGMFLKGPGFPAWLAPLLLCLGILLMTVGVVFYKILMDD